MATPAFAQVASIVEAHETELRGLGVEFLGVFGSVARGDETAESDVDLLVELRRPAGFFAYGALEDRLVEILEAKVEVTPLTSLKPRVRARVEKDLRRVL